MTEALDEAYDRLHHTGPEWGGNLANHGPMAAEVLARHGRSDMIAAWLDGYVRRLDSMPAPSDPVTEDNWQEALGDRVADWAVFLTRQAGERPWREVLATWWPRLLPGIAAGATHGVIRTGHAVRTLLAGDESDAALGELAHGLAYWAARSRTLPPAGAPAGSLDPGQALDAVPHIADQEGPIRIRLGVLAQLSGWPASVTALREASGPDDARERLAQLVTAATLRYLTHGYGSPVLMIHTATAPNAVLHTLPALPRELWLPSLAAVWAASAAITSMYGPPSPRPPEHASHRDADDMLERAWAHGDEHVIKFTDTAAEVFARTTDPRALASAGHAILLLEPS